MRDEPPPDDALVVVRAAALDRQRTMRAAVLDAAESAATYCITSPDGRREVLYGISVFALGEGRFVADVLGRFPESPRFLELTVGSIRAAGFDVIPTGANVAHYDVQLVPGRYDDDDLEITQEELRAAAARLLWAAGDPKPNPAYAGDEEEPEDEP